MKIVFVVNVYHDQDLALRLALQIRHFYPEALLLVLGDGVEVDYDLSSVSQAFSLPRIKHHISGAWTSRYLTIANSEKPDVIVKMDPDTCIWRRAALPEEADWFGTPSTCGKFLRGGAAGMSGSLATRLLASGLLERPTTHSYQRYCRFKWPHEKEDMRYLSCQDRIVGDAMKELGQPWVEWGDTNILGNTPRVPAERAEFAITHPHPTDKFTLRPPP